MLSTFCYARFYQIICLQAIQFLQMQKTSNKHVGQTICFWRHKVTLNSSKGPVPQGLSLGVIEQSRRALLVMQQIASFRSQSTNPKPRRQHILMLSAQSFRCNSLSMDSSVAQQGYCVRGEGEQHSQL